MSSVYYYCLDLVGWGNIWIGDRRSRCDDTRMDDVYGIFGFRGVQMY